MAEYNAAHWDGKLLREDLTGILDEFNFVDNDAALFDSMLEGIPYHRAKDFCHHINTRWTAWREQEQLAKDEADGAA